MNKTIEESDSKGAVWVRASERLPDESWKGKMRNITIDGTWHYEDNVPYKMIKGLLNHELDLQHEWLDETHIPEKGCEEVVEQNGCTCYYFNKFERKANSTCPVHNAKHQQAEQTNPVSELSDEIEAMAEEYANNNWSKSHRGVARLSFKRGYKAALQTSAAGWSNPTEKMELLFKECEHGDEQHRQWLKDKFDDFLKRKP